MIRELYRCIVFEHDYRFLLLAVLICLFASFTAVSLQYRSRLSAAPRQKKWLLLSAITIGGGIWATHFVAMLAYDAGMPVSYNLLPTVASIIVAIIIAGSGFALSSYRRGKAIRALSGGIVGIGISSMHFLGMLGIDVQGTISYDMPYVVLSISLSILLSIASFLCMNKMHDPVRYTVASLLLALTICTLHFTAMAGLTITYDPSVEMIASHVSQGVLGIWVGFVTLMLLGFSFFSAFNGQKVAFQQAQETQRFRRLADAALEGIVVLDSRGFILNANHSFCTMCGKTLSELKQRNIWRLFNDVESDQDIPVLTAQRVHMEETRLLTKDGKVIPTELFFRLIDSNYGLSYVVVVRDISQQRKAQQKISYLSNYDVLTGLVNRHLFMDRLQHAVKLGTDKEDDIAIFYIDIDSFKELNSLYGSEVGDEILMKVAERLSKSAPETCTLARFGADQFCLLQENIQHASNAVETAEVLTSAFTKPLALKHGAVPVSISIGAAVDPVDKNDPESLLSQAEIAVKQAKKVVGSSYRFYEDQFDKTLVRRRRLKRDLEDALKHGEISLVFQPQFHCLTDLVTGFEALVRWNHSELGFISPEEFIALAEESNQINVLGAWILDAACREAAKWDPSLSIAVNLSPVQFQYSGLMQLIDTTLERYNLDPTRLELEITEGVLIQDSEKALVLLNKLKSKGIKLAMDDFGTGYSSLAYLQTFPFDKLKIDKSFVQVMLESDHKLNIVRGMIGLARGLKMPVLAEGVETEAQHAILRAEGCNEVQGYYLGKPLAIEKYTKIATEPALSTKA